ncbi:MAG TPA: 3D domain-containing protein [Spirochaetota bacterium]|nr:3D domain-containing protein [Spirochaetota bacterium]HPI90842.1 3D domain-containing protein [Spirochaetota bacterium]HPR49869.1 3D domain-containing protein [Spirochaetota bacterium]
MRSFIALSFFISVLVAFLAYDENIAIAFSKATERDLLFFHKEYKELAGFTITAYCPGKCCNGKWAGLTATGKDMNYYLDQGINIIAVDPSVIPLGSLVIVSGKQYHAVDTGSLIKGKKVDILLKNHADTITFGIKENQTIKVLSQ